MAINTIDREYLPESFDASLQYYEAGGRPIRFPILNANVQILIIRKFGTQSIQLGRVPSSDTTFFAFTDDEENAMNIPFSVVDGQEFGVALFWRENKLIVKASARAILPGGKQIHIKYPIYIAFISFDHRDQPIPAAYDWKKYQSGWIQRKADPDDTFPVGLTEEIEMARIKLENFYLKNENKQLNERYERHYRLSNRVVIAFMLIGCVQVMATAIPLAVNWWLAR